MGGLPDVEETEMKIALFALVVSFGCFGAALAQAPLALPHAAMGFQVSPELLSPGGGVVKGCAREVTVKLQPDDENLRAAYGSSYAAVGTSEVKYTVYGSYVFGSNVICQYRGQSTDVLGLTYTFQCPAASPAGEGHRFAYRCGR